MRKYVLLVIGLILFGLASNANAMTLLLKDYKSLKDEDEKAVTKLWLDGVKEGLITFNALLPTWGRPPLFCLPEKLVLTVEQAVEIMMREAKTVTDPDQFPVSIILLHGLQETFPCQH